MASSSSQLSLLELTSLQREQPLLVESSPTDDRAHEFEHVRWPGSSRVPQRSMAGGLGRPPSYSDSFLLGNSQQTSFFLKDFSNSALAVCQETKDATTQTDSTEAQGFIGWPRLGIRISRSKIASIFKRTGSFLFHIWLISIFETVFFFTFISKSEDQGILKTVDNYIFAAANSCSNISTNSTAALNEILPYFINVSEISSSAEESFTHRTETNNTLLVKSWMYVVGIFGLLVTGSVVARVKKLLTCRQAKRILWENLILVGMLGVYEFIFFRTIIYNYDALSASEISEDAVQTLRASCGLFV
jgi:hypothetical protein